MVMGAFIYIRVLILNILMKAKDTDEAKDEDGEVSELLKDNFIYVSSILYHLFMTVVRDLTKNFVNDSENDGDNIFHKYLMTTD